jgi:hypothetical protein
MPDNNNITNMDVALLPFAGIRACLNSVEYWIQRDKYISREHWELIESVYNKMLDVHEHIVNGYPLRNE